MNKVYIHSRDINIRNINLNSRFGFELEGIFYEDLLVDGERRDVVRMALLKRTWLEVFSG
jgi:RimJ/RimL family protein N-acetyltransferase